MESPNEFPPGEGRADVPVQRPITDVAVIIPTCDRPESLAEALASVVGQTALPREIIVVDNGRQEVDRARFERIPGVSVVRMPPRVGASRARNIGVRHTRARFLAFLDDDDRWNEDYLVNVTRALEDGAQCVVSRLDEVCGSHVRVTSDFPHVLRLTELFARNPGVTGSNVVVRRDLYEQIGGYDEALPTSEDKSLLIDVILEGARITVLPENPVYRRADPDPDRLSHPRHVALGVAAFLDKYSGRMNWRQRAWNRYRIATLKRDIRDSGVGSAAFVLSVKLWDNTLGRVRSSWVIRGGQ